MFVTLILLERFAFLQLYRICASKFLFYFILLNISKMYLILVNYSVSSSSIASFLFCFNAANKSKNTSFSLFVVLPLLIWSVHKSGPYNGASITTCHRFKLWKKKKNDPSIATTMLEPQLLCHYYACCYKITAVSSLDD